MLKAGPLPFFITGAWDEAHAFRLETVADLPEGASLVLDVPRSFADALHSPHLRLARPAHHHNGGATHDDPGRVRIALQPNGSHVIGDIELPAGAEIDSRLLVEVPQGDPSPHRISIRQLYEGREVGSVSWQLVPPGDDKG
jgi:hypothetical protein